MTIVSFSSNAVSLPWQIWSNNWVRNVYTESLPLFWLSVTKRKLLQGYCLLYKAAVKRFTLALDQRGGMITAKYFQELYPCDLLLFECTKGTACAGQETALRVKGVTYSAFVKTTKMVTFITTQ